MPADRAADDLKAKFREALKKKKHGNTSGVDDSGHERERPPETHGPESVKREFKPRKTG